MSPAGPWEELRRTVERLLGLPPGSSDPAARAFDPLEAVRKDAQRFERVLGEGFVDIRNTGDAVVHRLQAAGDFRFPIELFELPKRLLEARPPGLDGFRGGT